MRLNEDVLFFERSLSRRTQEKKLISHGMNQMSSLTTVTL